MPEVGIELGYAQITSTFSTTSTTATDVTGLTTTVTVGTRPVKVIFAAAAIYNGTANGAVAIEIVEGTTILAATSLVSNPAGLRVPCHREVRLAPTAGSHTYKIRAYCVSGTANIQAAADNPVFIQVIEV